MLTFAKKTCTYFCLATCAALLLAGCQKSYDSFLNDGKQAIENNQYSTAVIALKNAIQLAPESEEARLLLADTYFSMGAYLSATKEYEKAAEFGAECVSTVEPFVIAQFRQFRLEDALDVEVLNCSSESLSNTVLLYQYLSAVQLDLRNIAYRIEEQAVTRFPEADETLLIRVYDLISQQKYAQAEQALKNLTQTSSLTEVKFAKAWLLSFGTDYQRVLDELLHYQTLEPNDLRATILKARMYLLTSNYDKVKEEAERVLQFFPNHRESNSLMSMAFFRQKQYTQSISYAEKAIDLGSRNPQVRIVAGLSEFALQNLERAYQHLSHVEDKLADNQQLSQLYAYLQYRLGYDARLGDTSKSTNTTGLSLAEQYTASLFKSADADDISKLEEASKDDSGLSTLLLAGNYIELGNFDVAQELIAQYNAKFPNTTHGYNLQALLAAKQGNAEDAIAAAARSLEIEPSDIFAGQLTASEYISQAKFSEALTQVESILSVHQSDIKSLDLYLRLQNELKNLDKGLQKVKEIATTNPSNDELQKLYIKWLLRAQAYSDAVAFSQAVLQNNKVRDRDFYWQSIFDIYIQQKNMLAADTVASQWAEDMPDSTLPILRKANLFYALKQPQKAMDLLNAGIQRFPGEHTFKIIKARLLIGARQYKLAQNTLLSVPEQFRDFYQIRLMQSQILAKLGQPQNALNLLKEQYKETPNNEVATLIFGQLMTEGKASDAATFLKEHNARFENTISTQILLANQLMQSSPDEAKSMFEALIEKGVKSPQVFNNLSWLYFEKNAYDTALEHASEALKLAPNNVQVMDTLANIYMAKGDKEKALAYVNEGLRIAPNASNLKTLHRTITTQQ